jgi:hypothetical protein
MFVCVCAFLRQPFIFVPLFDTSLTLSPRLISRSFTDFSLSDFCYFSCTLWLMQEVITCRAAGYPRVVFHLTAGHPRVVVHLPVVHLPVQDVQDVQAAVTLETGNAEDSKGQRTRERERERERRRRSRKKKGGWGEGEREERERVRKRECVCVHLQNSSLTFYLYRLAYTATHTQSHARARTRTRTHLHTGRRFDLGVRRLEDRENHPEMQIFRVLRR